MNFDLYAEELKEWRLSELREEYKRLRDSMKQEKWLEQARLQGRLDGRDRAVFGDGNPRLVKAMMKAIKRELQRRGVWSEYFGWRTW